ncbi:ATP synthase F1 subunit delta [Saccharicrinis sp. FJH62]|uniref:ATP synthase F1 subunit delta n=1 Tax=Saccharicrinis sp. FJH62 TaxID=3344657 RepID=UPI0035D3FD3A
MDNSRVRVRYCKALQELAVEKKLEDAILQDMKQLLRVIQESEDFKKFLKNTTLTPSKKKTVMHALFKGKLNALTLSFLDLVFDYERESMLLTIVYHYIESARLAKGIRKATVTTAVDIDPGFKKKLYQKLEKSMGSKLEFEEKVDPEIIGGFILRVDDLQLDASISGKLAKIKKSLINS